DEVAVLAEEPSRIVNHGRELVNGFLRTPRHRQSAPVTHTRIDYVRVQAVAIAGCERELEAALRGLQHSRGLRIGELLCDRVSLRGVRGQRMVFSEDRQRPL